MTSSENDDVILNGGRDVMEACASRLNASLQRVQQLDEVLAEQMSISDDDDELMRRPLTVIQATPDCTAARMTPVGLLYLSSGWLCPQQLQLDLHLWRCLSRSYSLSVVLSLETTQHTANLRPAQYKPPPRSDEQFDSRPKGQKLQRPKTQNADKW